MSDEGDATVPEEARKYPSTIGGAFYILVLLCALAGLGLAVLQDWRTGVRVVASALLLGALCRTFLPPKDAGMLAVRSRPMDVVMLVGIAGCLLYLAGNIPDQPGA